MLTQYMLKTIILLLTIMVFSTANAENHGETRDKRGQTPLMVALYEQVDMARIISLLDKGADVNARNIYGTSALMYAITYHDNEEAVAELIKRGADVAYVREAYNDTAIIEATRKMRSIETIRLLIENGADLNVQNIQGETALMKLFEGFDIEANIGNLEEIKNIAKLLLAHNAGVNFQNGDGSTALMYSARTADKEILLLLLDAGADMSIKNKLGYNVIKRAKNSLGYSHYLFFGYKCEASDIEEGDGYQTEQFDGTAFTEEEREQHCIKLYNIYKQSQDYLNFIQEQIKIRFPETWESIFEGQ